MVYHESLVGDVKTKSKAQLVFPNLNHPIFSKSDSVK